MTKGFVGSVIRSGATTATVWRRRRKMRSAIVPSLLSSFVACGSSLSSPGGDGAMFSVESVSFVLMSSPTSVGADVGGYAAGGGARDVGGACDARPGKNVSMKRAWGET
eukprot:5379731-Pleurochrysis_carterae.AAC.2